MKKSLVVWSAVIILLLVTVLGSCGGNTTKSSTPSGTTSVTTTATLSEQPDKATYNKYFSELGIGWMPIEVRDPPKDLKKNVSVFKTTDQICFYGTVIRDCQPKATFYDVVAKKVIRQDDVFPSAMSGGFANWEPIELPAGQYECKIYVDSVLAAVFPFQVQ